MYVDPNKYFKENPPYITPDEYYQKHKDLIIKHHEKYGATKWYMSYPFDWISIFTPIERDAWNIIRIQGRIVMYPQYPVLNYRLDFGNPFLKIALECDGKDFHKPERDMVRDERLWKEGWRVFRVTGSELYKIIELQEADEYGEGDNMDEYYLESAEGVVEAIKAFYFFPEKLIDDYSRKAGYIRATLEKHRLAQFPI